MTELDSISVKGFKSIASLEDFRLGNINVIIGPNGSGKSNFIEVFNFLHFLREGHLQEYVARAGGAEKLLHFGSKTTEKIAIHLSFNNGVNQYEIELVPTAADELLPASEYVYYWEKLQYPSPYSYSLERNGKEAGISKQHKSGVAKHVREHLDRWRLYHFHDTSSNSPMKKTGDIHDNNFLRPDGSNLASFLFYLQKKHEPAYSFIRKTVQLVAPFFDDFVLKPLQLNPNKIQLQWRHKGSEAYFDAASFSDGTLRFIALATLFLQPSSTRPSVILVDEPELGLHPYAINILASIAKQSSTETQIILSTQSSLLLDEFEPKDVIVAERVEQSTHFKRLEPDRLADMMLDYSLGQLWEKNELGGRPRGN